MGVAWIERLRSQPASRAIAIAVFWLVVGVVLWSFGVFGLWQHLAVLHAPRSAFLLTLGAMSALLLLRTRMPMLALGVGVVVATLDVLMGASLAVVAILTDLIYAAVKYGSVRGVRILLRIAVAAGIGLAIGIPLVAQSRPDLAVMLFQWALIVLVSGLWGGNVRAERVLTRTELAGRHAAENRELRTRIAHDLHDLVANQIAVAGLHIEAAKLQAAKLQSAGGLAQLTLSLDRATSGTERAHRELRDLISVLTVVDEVAGDGDPSDPVRLAEAFAQLGQMLPAGRAFDWETGAKERLSEALQSAEPTRAKLVLRALQELVANSAKHGEGNVSFRTEVTPDGSTMRVSLENAVPPHPPVRPPGTGLGIGGTRVLLASVGGELESAQAPGGWRATLTVPLHHTEAGRPQ
ncbi:sensor histidine kinase [Leucobacter komagatae]|uniref:histidine kinase n=1 Tax=Leucobacter komagatae TaxID=55969 RepID=A0A0D0HYH6_9MICO|nr:histidine kinase [Leucobacter komagatae]KIP52636.1 hypothetical protein SD72_07665 [Leucobacter komagatae]